MPSIADHQPTNRPWRSLAELADAPEFRAFMEAEFPAKADPEGVSRRRWLQLMGASLALAGSVGCRWEKEEILPFAERPEGRVPGTPERYATAMDLSGSAIGLLVTVYDGRPVKVEGNPNHPQSLGATDALAQAAILNLYDPDRSRQVLQREATTRGTVAKWEQFDTFAKAHFDELRGKEGKGLAVLAEADSSPTAARLRDQLLQALPEAAWYEYEPLSRDNERAGAVAALGKPYRTHIHVDQAKVIVSFDADLFGDHPTALRNARQYSSGRDPAGEMNRLYVVESCYSITGAAADHRVPVRAGQVGRFAAAVEAAIAGASADIDESWQKYVDAIADDLKRHGPHGLLVAGPRQPAEVHAAVHRINAKLGSVGTTVTYTEEPDSERSGHFEAIQELAQRMAAGEIETVVVLGGNPVYDAPCDLGFAEAFAKAPTRIHLSLDDNETSQASTWHLPRAHFLEAWGDARSHDGTYSIVQPMIEPLWDGRSKIELLASLIGSESSAYDLVRETARQLAGADDFEACWQVALHDGVLANSQWPTVAPNIAEAAEAVVPETDDAEEFDVVFVRDASVYDGRFANCGWLQELPDPMSRLTWDNAALIGPSAAERLGVKSDQVIAVTVDGRTVELPVFIMPGQADRTIGIALGYGRTAAGYVGGSLQNKVAPVGVDAYAIRPSASPWFAPATVAVTGKTSRLATTQDHHAIDTIALKGIARRLGELVRETTQTELHEHPEVIAHALHLPGGVEEEQLKSLWTEHSYDGRRWGMSIDMNKCIGCGACVVACQAENNIPVVGKERVLKGREMHWLRIDRYFRGDPENPSVSHQPVACQQCENAPCEQVCPVAATVHSKEGLNDMVYNRCVGTRYCGNNCPYKVRRFNYFYYHFDLDKPGGEVAKMAFNPEVTVRTRGVMEKCTYCVQRIQAGKIAAKNEGREVRDGEIRSACQQACPAQAIEFGDLSDQESKVAAAHQSNRAYGMLAELNVKPRTKYLARVRNPHPSPDDQNHEQRSRHG
ncbi:MAG: TAT-variant-translocated molybdopterin oxidoreductase [Planctomycetaceae bacterium]|nr:TAT-variant-translocated molybdopterin oxidoreductase [Planctomycetaceae bacterium]